MPQIHPSGFKCAGFMSAARQKLLGLITPSATSATKPSWQTKQQLKQFATLHVVLTVLLLLPSFFIGCAYRGFFFVLLQSQVPPNLCSGMRVPRSIYPPAAWPSTSLSLPMSRDVCGFFFSKILCMPAKVASVERVTVRRLTLILACASRVPTANGIY